MPYPSRPLGISVPFIFIRRTNPDKTGLLPTKNPATTISGIIGGARLARPQTPARHAISVPDFMLATETQEILTKMIKRQNVIKMVNVWNSFHAKYHLVVEALNKTGKILLGKMMFIFVEAKNKRLVVIMFLNSLYAVETLSWFLTPFYQLFLFLFVHIYVFNRPWFSISKTDRFLYAYKEGFISWRISRQPSRKMAFPKQLTKFWECSYFVI